MWHTVTSSNGCIFIEKIRRKLKYTYISMEYSILNQIPCHIYEKPMQKMATFSHRKKYHLFLLCLYFFFSSSMSFPVMCASVWMNIVFVWRLMHCWSVSELLLVSCVFQLAFFSCSLLFHSTWCSLFSFSLSFSASSHF